jgi:heat shock protein HslJ
MKRIFVAVSLILLAGLIQCKPDKEKKEEMATPEEKEVIPLGDTSRTSVDWDGTYLGFLPCADCEGILTELTLRPDGTYQIKRVYWGKDRDVHTSGGSFRWDDTGGKIRLEEPGAEPGALQFQVGENRLFQLDRDGNRIQSDFAERYELAKRGHLTGVEGVHWKLVELRGQAIPQTPPSKAFFTMVPGSGRVSGNGGCNSIMGGYEIMEGSRVSFSQFASTMMACPDVDYETEYLKVFEMADNFTLRGDTLSLNKARMAPLARFVASFPD